MLMIGWFRLALLLVNKVAYFKDEQNALDYSIATRQKLVSAVAPGPCAAVRPF